MINWSLFQLNGAMPLTKTITRETLPEELIPKDEKVTETHRQKRRRPDIFSQLNAIRLAEVTDVLPWLEVTSSSEESENESSSETDKTRKIKHKWRRNATRRLYLLFLI